MLKEWIESAAIAVPLALLIFLIGFAAIVNV